MVLAKEKLLFAFVIVGMLVGGSSAVFAQACTSTTPNYSPDFTSNQDCLMLNGINYANSSTEYPSFQSPIATAPPTVSTVLRLTPASTYWAGSAWFQTPQPVSGSFTTTFTFQLNPASGADGIAFVIQNSGLRALGAEGCGEGFGADLAYPPGCTPVQGPQSGITNSIAIRFNSYSQGVGGGTQTNDPGVNNVSIQSCPDMAANSITAACQLAAYPFSQVAFADGNVHTATVTYRLIPTSSQTNCSASGTPGPCLDVIVDGAELFPAGVPFNMTTIGLEPSGNAYVGFTGATGGLDDNQDILSWVFTPQGQSQSGTVTPTTPATFDYNGGCNFNGSGCPGTGYTTTAAENPGSTLTIGNMVVTAIPIVAGSATNPQANQAACNAIVDAINPSTGVSPFVSTNVPAQTAQCFVYTNGGGAGIDAPVMFAVSCPPSGICDTPENEFFAALASYFTFTCAENPPLIAPTCSPVNSPSNFGNFSNLTATNGLPSVGFLQGAGPDPNNPCNPATGPNAPPLFQSNQIVSFTLGDTTSRPVKGGSTGLTSCWVATYDTPGEMPTATLTSGPTNGATYQQGATVSASYTCTAISTDPDSILDPNGYPAAGPYLTVSSCSASSGLTAGGGTPTSSSCTPAYPPALNSCAGTITIDTGEVGPHILTLDAEDSATNTASQQVAYTVQGNQASLTLSTTSPLVYNQSETLSVLGGTTGGAVTYNLISGPCTVVGNQLMATSGTGSCTLTATMAGNSNYNAVTSTTSTVSLALAPQTITFTTNAPASAAYNASFTVAAIASSGLPVTYSSAGSCTGGPTYMMTNSTGTCSVLVGQAGNTNYSAAAAVTQTVTATGPLVTVTPASFNFGTVYFGLTLDPVLVEVHNTGTSTASISASLTLASGSSKLDFTLIDNYPPFNLCSSTLAAGKTCYIVVVFFAGNVGTIAATLNVTTNSPGSPLQATFLANVIDPQASLSPTSLSFGTQNPNSSTTKTVTLKNTGTTALSLTNITLTGTNASNFTLTVSSSPCGSSLPAGSSCVLDVTFKPTAKGSFSAILHINDNSITGSMQSVPLSGAGN
jgi:Bacterial lectin/Abnormal spindle-like microcephaly-assoc'd, ASPM-SPD-2-Hydin